MPQALCATRAWPVIVGASLARVPCAVPASNAKEGGAPCGGEGRMRAELCVRQRRHSGKQPHTHSAYTGIRLRGQHISQGYLGNPPPVCSAASSGQQSECVHWVFVWRTTCRCRGCFAAPARQQRSPISFGLPVRCWYDLIRLVTTEMPAWGRHVDVVGHSSGGVAVKSDRLRQVDGGRDMQGCARRLTTVQVLSQSHPNIHTMVASQPSGRH